MISILIVFMLPFSFHSDQKSDKPTNYYAAVFTIGLMWDNSKPAHQQMNFADHSRNLKRLQESGSMALGARHGKYGLIVVKASDENEARSLFDWDSTITKKVFTFEITTVPLKVE